MLSILPYDRSSGQRDTTERPFKSYHRAPVSLQGSSLYPSLTQSSLSGALGLSNSYNSGLSSTGQNTSPTGSGNMDVRTHTGLPDPYGSHGGLMDMSQSSMHRMQYKQEQLYGMHSSLSGPGGYPSHPYMNHSGTGNGMPDLPDLTNGVNPTTTNTDMLTKGGDLQSHTPAHMNTVSSTTGVPGMINAGEPRLNGTVPSPNLGSPVLTPPGASNSIKMPPKKRPLSVPDDLKDNSYWEKRKKNNDSAKRSRDGRRMKEEQIAMRVVYLEQENLQLRTEASLLKSEIEKLRCMLYS